MSDNYKKLRDFCQLEGIDLFGVADISQIKEKFFLSAETKNRFNRAVSLGIGLSRGILEDIQDEPTRLYLQHYKTLNYMLDQTIIRIAKFIEREGALALPISASQILDWQNHSVHLSHREIGYLAGLGWIGRNNLLVNEQFGSQLRLATILTNLDLPPDKPTSDDCGTCLSCVNACPAGAISEKKEDFNLKSCFDKLKDFQKRRIVDQFICGVCVKSCRGIKNANINDKKN